MNGGWVVIPAYGHPDITQTIVGDCLREDVRVALVDNGGDFPGFGNAPPRIALLEPPKNLGWLRGTNFGVEHAVSNGAEWVVALNNDTRLAPGFFAGLHEALQAHPSDLIAPCYNDHLDTQNSYYRGPIKGFTPEPVEHSVRVIDGTCYALTADLYRRLGPLDQRFKRRGWGAIEDYVMRLRKLGGDCYVTHRAYLTHDRGHTAKRIETAYEARASAEMRRGLLVKYGRRWRDHFGYSDGPDGLRTIVRDRWWQVQDRYRDLRGLI